MKGFLMTKAISLVAAGCVALGAARADVADEVNTGIGSISHMLVPTLRTVQRPNAQFLFNAAERQYR